MLPRSRATALGAQGCVKVVRMRRFGRPYAEQHRVFRMAPLHHHFEQLGWHESTVVTRFYILGLICALIGLATLKIR